MPVGFDQDGKWEFAFVPEFADCIARIASLWARLEYDIDVCIWALADIRPALGACITAQIYTTNGRISALLALADVRNLDPRIIGKVNKFASAYRDALDARNRTIHDLWLKDQRQPENMGRLRIKADKKLKFSIESYTLLELQSDMHTVEKRVTEFDTIRKSIEAALPSLPEIPSVKLHPIREIRWGR